MLKAKQAWCLLASWLVSIVLCLGEQSIYFTGFDDRNPSIRVISHCAGVATVHPDAGQPEYRDAPGHIS